MSLFFNTLSRFVTGLPCGSDSEEYGRNAGDQGLMPQLGRFHGEEHGNPLQYSCLENHMDRTSPAGYGLQGHKKA